MLLEEAGGSDRAASVAEGVIAPSVHPPFLSKGSLPKAEAGETKVAGARQGPAPGSSASSTGAAELSLTQPICQNPK